MKTRDFNEIPKKSVKKTISGVWQSEPTEKLAKTSSHGDFSPTNSLDEREHASEIAKKIQEGSITVTFVQMTCGAADG